MSTEEKISAAAVQLRAFGDVKAGIRFFTEAAWAARSDEVSDVFGAAYPYANRVQVIEAYGERLFRPRNAVVAVRAGRYRTPFGISNASDHGYTGFLRAPLIRYDGYFALSNNFLEHGADLVAGVPRLTVEASIGRPGVALPFGGSGLVSGADAEFRRTIHCRRQSHSNSPHLPGASRAAKAFSLALDLRWMRDGVQLRGEWIWPAFRRDDARRAAQYAGAIVHHIATADQ